MKNLYVLITDGGDGSYSPHFTFNSVFVEAVESKYNNGHLEHGDLGVDGDGFSYTTLSVPDECTIESLGVRDVAVYYAELLEDATEEV